MSLSSVKVSVICPSLNERDFIYECLSSAVNQTLHDIEILCVDAGSTDGTLEIIKEFVRNDSRVHLINSEIRSYGYQVNLGIKIARGKYVAILETDDLIQPNMYEMLYQAAEANDAETVKSDYYIFTGKDDNRTITRKNLSDNTNVYEKVINTIEDHSCFRFDITTWNGIYRKSFLIENNILHNESPGASYQDTGFYFQTCIYARRMYLVPEAYYMLRRDNPASSVYQSANMFNIIQEFAFIFNLLKRNKNLYESFKYDYAAMYVICHLWALDRVPFPRKEEFIRKFRRGLFDLLDENILKYTYFDYWVQGTLFKIINNVEDYITFEFRSKAILYEEMCKNNHTIIYGAGSLGKRLLNEIKQDIGDNVFCFAVSDKTMNLSEYDGIPIHAVHELLDYKDDSLVVVAVKKAFQKEIQKMLYAKGFKHILFAYWDYCGGGIYFKMFISTTPELDT